MIFVEEWRTHHEEGVSSYHSDTESYSPGDPALSLVQPFVKHIYIGSLSLVYSKHGMHESYETKNRTAENTGENSEHVPACG